MNIDGFLFGWDNDSFRETAASTPQYVFTEYSRYWPDTVSLSL